MGGRGGVGGGGGGGGGGSVKVNLETAIVGFQSAVSVREWVGGDYQRQPRIREDGFSKNRLRKEDSSKEGCVSIDSLSVSMAALNHLANQPNSG